MTDLKTSLLGGTSSDPIDPIKADFRNFLYIVWKHLNLPDPTPLQYDLAAYLQHGPARQVDEAFRGVGKSWVTSAFVCWLLYCDPQLNILVVSASKVRADDFTTFTKRLINELPLLAHLQAKEGQRDSSIAFDVGPARASHSPSVKSVGITGQLSGSRADVIVADDVEVPNNAMTETLRTQLSERVKEFDAVLKPGGRIIYLGTPQTEMSLYNRLPERGYTIRVWPARVPEKPETYKGTLAPYITAMIERGVPARTPTDPIRFNDMDLMEREASYARSGFALQFMLDTTLSDKDRYPLKLSDLMVHTLDPRMAPGNFTWCNSPERVIEDLPNVGLTGDRLYRPMWMADEMAAFTGCVMAIDPSGRGKDETAYAIVKILHGFLFLVASGGFTDGYSVATLTALSNLAKLHSVNEVIVEPNFGDGMFTQLLKPIMGKVHPCKVEECPRHSVQKERRMADTLEPLMNQHRLIVDRKVVQSDYDSSQEDPKRQLLYQLTRLTREKGSLAHDDRLDALAIACAYWVAHMARDTQKAADEHKASLLDEELKRFAEHVFGRVPEQETWMRQFNP